MRSFRLAVFPSDGVGSESIHAGANLNPEPEVWHPRATELATALLHAIEGALRDGRFPTRDPGGSNSSRR